MGRTALPSKDIRLTIAIKVVRREDAGFDGFLILMRMDMVYNMHRKAMTDSEAPIFSDPISDGDPKVFMRRRDVRMAGKK